MSTCTRPPLAIPCQHPVHVYPNPAHSSVSLIAFCPPKWMSAHALITKVCRPSASQLHNLSEYYVVRPGFPLCPWARANEKTLTRTRKSLSALSPPPIEIDAGACSITTARGLTGRSNWICKPAMYQNLKSRTGDSNTGQKTQTTGGCSTAQFMGT